jgi:hypothetical protein
MIAFQQHLIAAAGTHQFMSQTLEAGILIRAQECHDQQEQKD